MDIQISVAPDDGTPQGWLMSYYRWDGPDAPNPEVIPIEFDEGDDGFVATITVGNGEYGFACDVTNGQSIEIDLDPRKLIVQPEGGEWPFEARGGQTQDIITIVFDTRQDQ